MTIYRSLVVCPTIKIARKWLMQDAPIGAVIDVSRVSYTTENREVHYVIANTIDQAYNLGGNMYRGVEYRADVPLNVLQYLNTRIRWVPE